MQGPLPTQVFVECQAAGCASVLQVAVPSTHRQGDGAVLVRCGKCSKLLRVQLPTELLEPALPPMVPDPTAHMIHSPNKHSSSHGQQQLCQAQGQPSTHQHAAQHSAEAAARLQPHASGSRSQPDAPPYQQQAPAAAGAWPPDDQQQSGMPYHQEGPLHHTQQQSSRQQQQQQQQQHGVPQGLPASGLGVRRRRAPTAYHEFVSHEMKRLKTTHPGIDHQSAFKLAASSWVMSGAKAAADQAKDEQQLADQARDEAMAQQEVQQEFMAARGDLGLADSTAQHAMLGQYSSSGSLGLQGQHGMQFSAMIEPLGTGSYSGAQPAPPGQPVAVAADAPGPPPDGGAEVQLASLAGDAAGAGNSDQYGAQLADPADPGAAAPPTTVQPPDTAVKATMPPPPARGGSNGSDAVSSHHSTPTATAPAAAGAPSPSTVGARRAGTPPPANSAPVGSTDVVPSVSSSSQDQAISAPLTLQETWESLCMQHGTDAATGMPAAAAGEQGPLAVTAAAGRQSPGAAMPSAAATMVLRAAQHSLSPVEAAGSGQQGLASRLAEAGASAAAQGGGLRGLDLDQVLNAAAQQQQQQQVVDTAAAAGPACHPAAITTALLSDGSSLASWNSSGQSPRQPGTAGGDPSRASPGSLSGAGGSSLPSIMRHNSAPITTGFPPRQGKAAGYSITTAGPAKRA